MCEYCTIGMHTLCIGPNQCKCTHSLPVGSLKSEPEPEEETGRHPKRNREKSDRALKDQQSTGRKRAARKYPLNPEAACEWQGLKNCGGGTSPIQGCADGKQQARHHGPDKSVSNNDEGNVHRICHRCHNRWHAANNKDYDWNSTLVEPHNPVPMTELEIWTIRATEEGQKFKKIKD